jgi:AAA+ superfamily predicted ATPase
MKMEIMEENIQELSLLQLCNKVKESVDNNQLKDCKYLSMLESKFGLTRDETIVFSTAIAIHMSRRPNYKIHPVEMLRNCIIGKKSMVDTLDSILESLVLKNLLKIDESVYLIDFAVPEKVEKSISNNNTPKFNKPQINLISFAEKLESILFSYRKNERELIVVKRGLHKLEKNFGQLPVCSFSVKAKFSLEEKIVYYLIITSILKGEKALCLEGVCQHYFGNYIFHLNLKKAILSRGNKLANENWIKIEHNKYAGDLEISTSKEFIDLVMGEDKDWIKDSMPREVIEESNQSVLVRDPANIQHQDLFYNDNVQSEINMISDVLSDRRYRTFIDIMEQEKQLPALTILLSGPPGTGKTETALQWAKASGRLIYTVDFSELINKYVGDSEKAIKKMFTQYKESMKKEPLCPILFFNEADAIISKRVSIQRSLDQFNNTVQNILLDELENFSGILIATSNHLMNMDEAFMRRFLYKIELSNPLPMARLQILKSRFPFLKEMDIVKLNDIPFTGAQINNVLRKRVVHKLQFGKEINADIIREWLLNDISMTPQKMSTMGFKSMSSF